MSGTTTYNWPLIAESQSGKYLTHNDALEQIDAEVAAIAAGGVSIPVATSSVLGGVKDGTGVTVAGDGTLSVNYGTAAGTAAQGDDTRITGALAASSARVPPDPSGNASKPLRVNSGATALEYYSPPYDVAVYVEGTQASASEVLFRFVSPRAWSLESGASGAAKAGTAATGSTVFTVAKNGASIGTLTWSAAGTDAVVSITSTTAFAAGDVLSVTGPATADTTLANIAIAFAGTRA